MEDPAGKARAADARAPKGGGSGASPALVDERHLERQVAGDLELREELLQLYAVQLESLAPKLEGPAGRERREAAHALKGASLAIGAFALAHLCGGLDSAESGQSASAPELVRVVEATRRRVQELLGRPISPPET